MLTTPDFERIKKECFWDLQISEQELQAIPQQTDLRRLAFLFEKILLNSSRYLTDLQLFSPAQIKQLLDSMQLSQFNHEHAFHRHNIAQVYFLDQPLRIPELQWNL